MTSGEVVLFANLGAEEGARAPAHGWPPLVRAWARLFGAPVVVDGAGAVDDPYPSAAFPFLRRHVGLIPWLATEAAVARARALGVDYAGADVAATSVVHDKAFAVHAAREQGVLPDALAPFVVVLEPAELRAPTLKESLVAYARGLPAFADGFTLKPRRGTSGRGRVPGPARIVDDQALLDACVNGARHLAARGGAILEPWVRRARDHSIQLFVDDDGSASALGVTDLLVSTAGVWRGNSFALDEQGHARSVHAPDLDDALVGVALAVGARAARAGYRGPLGVDAYTFLVDGREIVHPLVEVNARFTGGIVAIGAARGERRAAGAPLVFDARTCTLDAA